MTEADEEGSAVMLSKTMIVVASTLVVVSPASAWAFGGIGCADLPDYARAQGALEGMTGVCDMSIEQARRIVAAQDRPASVHRYGASGIGKGGIVPRDRLRRLPTEQSAQIKPASGKIGSARPTGMRQKYVTVCGTRAASRRSLFAF